MEIIMIKTVKTKRVLLGSIIKYIFLLVMAFVFAMPMVFTLMSSVKTKTEIFAKPFSLPEVFLWGNYIEAWQAANMSRYFLNSIFQAGMTVIVLAIVSSMAAYVLSRFQFRGYKFMMIFFML